MSGHTKWSKLREELEAKPGAKKAITAAERYFLERLKDPEYNEHYEAAKRALKEGQ